ncbi:MAG: hypothetical protein RIS70_1149 [Planctomycetota bacterium]
MAVALWGLIWSFGVADDANPKSQVPDNEAQKLVAAKVADIYKPDYAKAKTSVQKVELARTLLKEGQGTKDDLVARFVLVRIARDIAAQQGDLGAAFEAIELLESDYEIDTISMRLDTAGVVPSCRSVINDGGFRMVLSSKSPDATRK